MLAVEWITQSGMPSRSTTTWRFEPAFPYPSDSCRLCCPPFCRDGSRVQTSALPLYLVGLAKTVQKHLVQTLPYPCLLPLTQSPPARNSRATAHLLGQHLPRYAAFEDEDDAAQSGPVIHTGPTTFGFRRLGRQQRFDGFPQYVWNQFFCHVTDRNINRWF